MTLRTTHEIEEPASGRPVASAGDREPRRRVTSPTRRDRRKDSHDEHHLLRWGSWPLGRRSENRWADRAGLDQRSLRALVDHVAQFSVEVGRPDEEPLLEVSVELRAHRRGGVQAGVVSRPLVETSFRRAGPARIRRRALLEVPANGWLVEPVPGVLADDQAAPWRSRSRRRASLAPRRPRGCRASSRPWRG